MATISLSVSHDPSADTDRAVSARLDAFVEALVDEDGVTAVAGTIATATDGTRTISVTAPAPGDDTPEG